MHDSSHSRVSTMAIISKMIKPTVLLMALLCSLADAFSPSPLRCGIKSRNHHYFNYRQTNNTGKQIVGAIYNTNNSIEDEESEEDVKKRVQQEIFWAKQRAMAAQFEAKQDAELKSENREKFAKRRLALVSDTAYFSVLIACLLWLVSTNPFVTISYLFGTSAGTAYSYGLGKYVETIGGSIDDTEAEGAGIGQARFAFLILLFVVVGKFRDQGLLEIPSIMGFFTYQLASLSQGLREIDD